MMGLRVDVEKAAKNDQFHGHSSRPYRDMDPGRRRLGIEDGEEYYTPDKKGTHYEDLDKLVRGVHQIRVRQTHNCTLSWPPLIASISEYLGKCGSTIDDKGQDK